MHDAHAAEPEFEVRLLGPVQVVRAGREVGLGGPKQRAVLALLLVDPGRVVSADSLLDAVWNGAPPPGARRTLASYVSRLRAALRPDAALTARAGGYLLAVDPGRVDALRFGELVRAGQDLLDTRPAMAAGRFGEALALWRGPALAGVTEVEPLAREAARLEELQLAAVEGRLEAELAAGRQAEVTGELERLVTEFPLRERLWRLLILALYRAERQADALAAYRRAREMLASELGVEPGVELRSLEQAVLRQQVPAVPEQARNNMPAQLTSFVGRVADVTRLEELVGAQRLITLTGTGGTGKTRLALEVAARAAVRFADGAWLADLSGISRPGMVAGQVMAALGVRQTGDVPVLDALRFRLQSADLLLVLDNCEHLVDACSGLARSLLAGAPGLRILATSREAMGITGEIIYPVPPLAFSQPAAGQRDLAAVPAAVRLFLDRATAACGGSPAAAMNPDVVARICRQLDGLPLAIELAAARTGTLQLQELEMHLADRFRFLAYRRPVADPRHQTLRAAIDWSYDQLPEPEARALRQLSVFAGGFRIAEAAAVWCGGDEAAMLEIADALTAKSLLVTEATSAGTLFRMLETIRDYSAALLQESGEIQPTRLRHAHAFLNLAKRERGRKVLLRELDNFRAALDWSLDRGDPAGPQLAAALGGLWLASGLFQEARAWLDRALPGCHDDLPLRAELQRLLGTVLYETGPLDHARAVLSDASAAAAAAGLPAAQARIEVMLADIRCMQGADPQDVMRDCQNAAQALQAAGDVAGLAEAWLVISQQLFYLDDSPADQDALGRAAGYARESGNDRALAEISKWLVVTSVVLSVPADVALHRAEQLLRDAADDPRAEANILQGIPPLYAYVGRLGDARAAVTRSQALHVKSGAKFDWALAAIYGGADVEMIAGNMSAAEKYLAAGIEVLRAGGEQGFLSTALGMLADVLYAQDRLDEAWQVTVEAETITAPDDFDALARWKATRARLLARRGQYAAARELADHAIALTAPTHYATDLALALIAKAEVAQLEGLPQEAASNLRRALHIYEDRHADLLAQHTCDELARILGPANP